MAARRGVSLSSRRAAVAVGLALVAEPAGGCLSLLPALAPSVDVEPDISAGFPFESRYVEVLGSKMHYVESGDGPTVLMVHGNPTSSYLWRNVIPPVATRARVVAVDLIGMGKSDKPNLDYRFEDHARYLERFIEALDLRDVTLVLHDWGGALGIDYAMRHPDNVRGIALMEAVAMPLTWDDADWATRYLFRRMRDPDDGKTLIVDDNFFVETLLPAMSGRELSDAEMQAYRAPYLRPKDRRPVRVWPLEIPIDGRPARTYERLGNNYEQLRRSDIPLLLLTADPGVILKRSLVERMQHDLPRLQTASIGSALHYVQEAQPHRIGEALRRWMESL